MATHQTGVSVRFDDPAIGDSFELSRMHPIDHAAAPSRRPSPALGTAMTEWVADLLTFGPPALGTRVAHPQPHRVTSRITGVGYVDFDAVESVHESPTGRPERGTMRATKPRANELAPEGDARSALPTAHA